MTSMADMINRQLDLEKQLSEEKLEWMSKYYKKEGECLLLQMRLEFAIQDTTTEKVWAKHLQQRVEELTKLLQETKSLAMGLEHELRMERVR